MSRLATGCVGFWRFNRHVSSWLIGQACIMYIYVTLFGCAYCIWFAYINIYV
ncbi:uncharacterized protein DS421_12g371360 [Arachis hypogaea]|nr:uncharacterized protein DS421_12g371360 [Arachis hypogaea]